MIMSGPSLRQLHAHHAIHEGALSGALTKTEEVEDLLRAKEYEVARQAADHLLEYWETRIISHADAEEEGFYLEMIEQNSELKQTVAELTRDHDILRIIVADIKKLLEDEGVSYGVMKQFHALLVINAIHSREEERLLLKEPAL